nr:PREDICTED: fibrous sheath-interacting protein 2 [Struthio camelus australis]
MKVHPDVTSEHLSVLSIRTESLEELNSSCLARTGQSLAQLRKHHLWRRQTLKESEAKEQEGEGKRFTLTVSGQLNVKPREVFRRNSFPNLWKPEITRVELLKDVTTTQDLLEHLVVHSVKKERSARAKKRGLKAPKGVELEVVVEEDEEEDTNEDILKVENSLICKSHLDTTMSRQEEARQPWMSWQLQKKASTCTIWARPSFLSKDSSARPLLPKSPHPPRRALFAMPVPTWPMSSLLARGLWHQASLPS